MNTLLAKLGLLVKLDMVLETSAANFVSAFRKNVDPDRIELFEVFSSSRNLYKGKIEDDLFSLRRRKRFGNFNFARGKATGRFREEDDRLFIEAEITGAQAPWLILYFTFLTCAYAFGLFVVIVSVVQDGETVDPVTVIFLLLHAVLMYGIPYFALRSAVRETKYEIERDFYYMTVRQKSHAGHTSRN